MPSEKKSTPQKHSMNAMADSALLMMLQYLNPEARQRLAAANARLKKCIYSTDLSLPNMPFLLEEMLHHLAKQKIVKLETKYANLSEFGHLESVKLRLEEGEIPVFSQSGKLKSLTMLKGIFPPELARSLAKLSSLSLSLIKNADFQFLPWCDQLTHLELATTPFVGPTDKILLQCPEKLSSLTLSGMRSVRILATKLLSLTIISCDEFILPNVASLTRLEIAACNQFDLTMLSKATQLEYLHCRTCNVTDFTALKSCTKLTELFFKSKLRLAVNYDDLGSLTSITKLTLCHFEMVSLVVLPPNLTSLTLEDSGLLEDVESIGLCVGLTDLMIANCSNITDLSWLTHNINLTRLRLYHFERILKIDLSGCSRLRELTLHRWPLTNLKFLAGAENLSSLSIVESTISRLEGLKHVRKLEELSISESNLKNLKGIKKCIKLRSLTIVKCRLLRDIAALSFCSKLKELTIQGCQNVDSVQALAKCKSISKLLMTEFLDVEEMTIFAEMTKLTSVIVRDCAKLARIGSLEACKRLREAEFSSCPLLEGIDESLGQCTKLVKLDLAHYQRLKNVKFLSKHHKLEELSLNNTNIVSLAPLSRLAKLSILYVNGCENLTDWEQFCASDTISRMRVYLPDCGSRYT